MLAGTKTKKDVNQSSIESTSNQWNYKDGIINPNKYQVSLAYTIKDLNFCFVNFKFAYKGVEDFIQ